MAEPLELPIGEARTRFVQLVRQTRVTRQATVITERGDALAAIVPPETLDAVGAASAAGWMRRLERVRADLMRQHATREAELVAALDEAWRLLDEARPPGTDRHVDTVRAAQSGLRR